MNHLGVLLLSAPGFRMNLAAEEGENSDDHGDHDERDQGQLPGDVEKGRDSEGDHDGRLQEVEVEEFDALSTGFRIGEGPGQRVSPARLVVMREWENEEFLGQASLDVDGDTPHGIGEQVGAGVESQGESDHDDQRQLNDPGKIGSYSGHDLRVVLLDSFFGRRGFRGGD